MNYAFEVVSTRKTAAEDDKPKNPFVLDDDTDEAQDYPGGQPYDRSHHEEERQKTAANRTKNVSIMDLDRPREPMRPQRGVVRAPSTDQRKVRRQMTVKAGRDPIAYTYEADVHCPACTRKRFPTTEGTDREGNQVGAIFPWDETSESGEYCADCGGQISPPHDDFLQRQLQEDLDYEREMRQPHNPGPGQGHLFGSVRHRAAVARHVALAEHDELLEEGPEKTANGVNKAFTELMNEMGTIEEEQEKHKHHKKSEMDLRTKLLMAVTEYDRKEEAKGGYYNHYALPNYLGAVTRLFEEFLDKGVPFREAVLQCFSGRLATAVLKAGGERAITRDEARGYFGSKTAVSVRPNTYKGVDGFLVVWKDPNTISPNQSVFFENESAAHRWADKVRENPSADMNLSDFEASKTAGITPGYYLVGPNGAPGAGPFATLVEAEAQVGPSRSAAVEYKSGTEDPEWDALRPTPFPYGLNTVNG